MIELVEWLVLLVTLPTRNKAERMRLWRTAKTLGCATLRDGAYLLPAREATGDALRALAAAVRAAGGGAEVLHVAADGAQDAAFRALFDRGADYAALLARIAQAPASVGPRELRALRRAFDHIAATDYFPGEAQRQAAAALAALAGRAGGEPHPALGPPRRLASADFQGQRWATSRPPGVGRLASAWLIQRFIDPAARFLWLATPAELPADALGFGFDGADFGHADGRTPYEVLLASFGLDGDAALARIGALVHYLEVGGVPVAEAAGVEAVLAGARAAAADEDALLAKAQSLFDHLYRNYRQETVHD